MKQIIFFILLLTTIIYSQPIDTTGSGSIALPDSVLFSTDSIAQRTFSDLKYVDKTTAQTITAQKNFMGTVKFGSDTSMILGYMDGGVRTGIQINQLSGHPYGRNNVFKVTPESPLIASWSLQTGLSDFTAGGVIDHTIFLGYNHDNEIADLQFGQGMEATYDMNDTTLISEWYAYYNSTPTSPVYEVRPFQLGTFRYGSSAPYTYTSAVTMAADNFNISAEDQTSLIEFRTQTYGATATENGRYYPTVSNALGNSMMFIMDSLWVYHIVNNFGWLYQKSTLNAPRELLRLDNNDNVVISPSGLSEISLYSPIYGSIRWRNNDSTDYIEIEPDTNNVLYLGANEGVFVKKIAVNSFPLDTTDLTSNELWVDPYGVVKYTIPLNIMVNGDFTSWQGTGDATYPTGWNFNYDTLHTQLVNNSDRLQIISDGTQQLNTWLLSPTLTPNVTYGWSFDVVSWVGDSVWFSSGGQILNPSYQQLSVGSHSGEIICDVTYTGIFGVVNSGDACDVIIDNVKVWKKNADKQTLPPTIYVDDTTGVTDGYVAKYIGGEVVWSPDISTSGAGLFNPDGVTIDTTAGGLARVLPAKVTKWDSVTVLTALVTAKQDADTDLDNPDIPLSAVQDSLTAKANTAWFAIAPSLIDDSITVKMNRSEMTGYATASHTHTEFFDTLSYSINIPDTVIAGDNAIWKIPNDITITEIAAFTNSGTVTFNIEERAEVTPNTAGTDVIGSDLVADTDQQETSTFSNASIDRDDWLALVVASITGDPTLFGVTIKYIKAN